MEKKEKSAQELQAEEAFRKAKANLAMVRQKEREKLRKEQERCKYMMGGIIHKYFPECYDFTELELNRIIACAFKSRDVQNMVAAVIRERQETEEGFEEKGDGMDEGKSHENP